VVKVEDTQPYSIADILSLMLLTLLLLLLLLNTVDASRCPCPPGADAVVKVEDTQPYSIADATHTAAAVAAAQYCWCLPVPLSPLVLM
jgi:hypothetical protein